MASLIFFLKFYIIYYLNGLFKILPILTLSKTLYIIINTFVSYFKWSNLLLMIEWLMSLERLELLLLLSLLWSYVFIIFLLISQDITNLIIIKNIFIIITTFISCLKWFDLLLIKKTDEFKMFRVTAAVAVINVDHPWCIPL